MSDYTSGVIAEAGLSSFRGAQEDVRRQGRQDTADRYAANAEVRAQSGERREVDAFQRDKQLWEEKWRLMHDQEAKAKYQERMNRALATFQSTGGQVYQPLVDVYNDQMPDGGKVHSLVRNDDGTYDIDLEHGGKRQTMKKLTRDQLGMFAMSIADPTSYLQMEMDAAGEQAKQAGAEKLQRLKNKGSLEAAAARAGGKTAKADVDMVETKYGKRSLSELREEFGDWRTRNPDLPDPGFEEWVRMTTGAVISKTSEARARAPLDVTKASFGELRSDLLKRKADDIRAGKTTTAEVEAAARKLFQTYQPDRARQLGLGEEGQNGEPPPVPMPGGAEGGGAPGPGMISDEQQPSGYGPPDINVPSWSAIPH